jgi:glyoxylase-like metal-dependent hydrolase (beta-lactamase superfamily II)/uncharacterized protein YjaZ
VAMMNKLLAKNRAIKLQLCFSFLILLMAGTSFSQEPSSTFRIISLMPDFYSFWEKAKDEPLENKIKLWNTLFEAKHAEFYRQVIYEGQQGEELNQIKAQKLKSFLGNLKEEDVERMEEKEKQLRKIIPQALDDLKKLVPEQKREINYYIIPSLNTSNGAGRPYNRDIIVYFGLEMFGSHLSRPEDIKALVAHETFHVFHFRNMAAALWEKYGNEVNLAAVIRGEGPLFFAFIEGMAVYTVEKLYPGVPRPGLIEDYVPQYQENFSLYTKEFLKDLKDFDYQKYKKYFSDPSDDPLIPDKFGYWLGYKIVQSLTKEFTIEEMMKWPPEKISQMAMQEINKILEAGEEALGRPGLGKPEVHKLTENVWAVTNLYHSAGKDAGVNAGIILTPKSIVFIDAGMTIASAEYLWKIASERSKGSENIDLILTHHHADHVFGMRVFKEKGAKVIAHRGVGEWLKDDKGQYKRFIIERSNMSPEEGDRIFGDVILSVPDQVIDQDTNLKIDGEEIQLLVTPGHVQDEICVYHPKSRTLFAGDTVYEGMPLNTRFGGPQEWKVWISQLERLKQLDIDNIVPGHGELCSKSELERNIAYLKSLLSSFWAAFL